MAESIHPVSIVQETRRRYLTYALSVITSRALPDVRDGLKPVQRRILYTMYHDLHLYADGRPRKCSKIVGDVIGNYHPHETEAAPNALEVHVSRLRHKLKAAGVTIRSLRGLGYRIEEAPGGCAAS